MHQCPARLIGDERPQAVPLSEPAKIEVLLHGEPRGQERRLAAGSGAHGYRSRVGDVQERQVDGGRELVGQLVHRIRAQYQRLRPCGPQALTRIDQQCARCGPVAGMLEFGDLGEVDRPQHQLRRVEAAQALACQLVEQAVVDGRALPAHPADQAQCPHEVSSGQ